MRNQSLTRVLGVLRHLEGGGRYRLKPMAEKFGVCERTIRRDIYALEAAGVPIGHTSDSDEGFASYWWLLKR